MMISKKSFYLAATLFVVSFLSLFFEVLFIRWIPASVQIMAFFPNIVLMAAFLGLGVGCLLRSVAVDLRPFLIFLLLALVLAILGFKNADISAHAVQGEVLRGFYAAQGHNFLLVMAALFIFLVAFFVPLGKMIGELFQEFPPLVAYSWNILGSLCGVAVFSLLSFFQVQPVFWFVLALPLLVFISLGSPRQMLVQVSLSLLVILLVVGVDTRSFWSPYHKVDITPVQTQNDRGSSGDYLIRVNNTHLQYAFDLSSDEITRARGHEHYKAIYEFPYQMFGPQKVLVLGAGSGNDVAAALRRGAESIDAVEIDPLIARLGTALHAESPYRSPRVRVLVDDARSFVRKTSRKYDLITFGYLDAHRVLSQFSSVRLDNFIYTRESFRDIKARLNSGGRVVLTYLGFQRWIEETLLAGLRTAFGDDVIALRTTTYRKDDTVILVAGEGVRSLSWSAEGPFRLDDSLRTERAAISDDWPYLYLFKRGVPSHYGIVLCLVLFMSLLALRQVTGLQVQRMSGHFFFLGAGFLLLETVSITRFALLFGSTWIVSMAVIMAVLAVILLANLWVGKTARHDPRIMYPLLGLAIFLSWLIPVDQYLLLPQGLAWVAASGVLALPLFFAGVIFAGSFRNADDVPSMLGFNLLGAILGGACEYLSMAFGFKMLYILALGMYIVSWLFLCYKRKGCGQM